MDINTLVTLTLISGFLGNAAALMAVTADLSYYYSQHKLRAAKTAARVLAPVALIGMLGFMAGMVALVQRAH